MLSGPTTDSKGIIRRWPGRQPPGSWRQIEQQSAAHEAVSQARGGGDDAGRGTRRGAPSPWRGPAVGEATHLPAARIGAVVERLRAGRRAEDEVDGAGALPG